MKLIYKIDYILDMIELSRSIFTKAFSLIVVCIIYRINAECFFFTLCTIPNIFFRLKISQNQSIFN